MSGVGEAGDGKRKLKGGGVRALLPPLHCPGGYRSHCRHRLLHADEPAYARDTDAAGARRGCNEDARKRLGRTSIGKRRCCASGHCLSKATIMATASENDKLVTDYYPAYGEGGHAGQIGRAHV